MKIERPSFPYEQFQSSLHALFPCKHTVVTLCASQDPKGRWLVRKQCTDCGKLYRKQLPYSILEGKKADSLPLCDLAKAHEYDRDYYSTAGLFRDLISQSQAKAWWKQYTAYLESPEWNERSRSTIEAAGGICSICKRSPATQAHHLTYERVGEELPEDLAAVCFPCHRVKHPHLTPAKHE